MNIYRKLQPVTTKKHMHYFQEIIFTNIAGLSIKQVSRNFSGLKPLEYVY